MVGLTLNRHGSYVDDTCKRRGGGRGGDEEGKGEKGRGGGGRVRGDMRVGGWEG